MYNNHYITLEVKNIIQDTNSSKKGTKTKAPKQFTWSDDSKNDYLTMISSPEFEHKFDQSVEVDHSDPNLLVNYLAEVLIDAAKKAKVKYRKCNSANDPPWFDKSCRELKSNVKTLGTKIRQNAKDVSLKSELYSKKKELKKLIRANKIKFKMTF